MPSEGAPACKMAADKVNEHIGAHKDEPEGHHPVFISALQFSFRNKAKAATGNYSQVFFESAYVEKAPVVFITSGPDKGELADVTDNMLIKLSYGTNDCKLTSRYAVGFNPPTHMGKEHLLSGVWSYERPRRDAFGESGQALEANVCTTAGVG